jgi:hypothetical protein
MPRTLAVLTLAMLAGCAGVQPQCALPNTVTVTVDRYVTPPAALLQHVPTEQPQDNTCGEAVRVARVRAGAIDQCNSHLDAIKQATQDISK